MLWIVTVKLPKPTHPHDPKNKHVGTCPLHDRLCTDRTGQHHSILHQTEDNYPVQKVIEYFEAQYHVTRVEVA